MISFPFTDERKLKALELTQKVLEGCGPKDTPLMIFVAALLVVTFSKMTQSSQGSTYKIDRLVDAVRDTAHKLDQEGT